MPIIAIYFSIWGRTLGPVRFRPADNANVQITVIGRFSTGEYFYDTDTVRIISPADVQEQ